MIFSPTSYQRLKTRLKNRYQKKLPLILRPLVKLKGFKLPQWLKENRDELSEYSPIHWHFLSQLEWFLQLATLSPLTPHKSESFTAEEDWLFERWHNSEFADLFLKQLNQGKGLKQASDFCLKQLDQHLIIWGERHLLRQDGQHKLYRAQASLGEMIKQGKIIRLLQTTLHLEGKELILMTPTLKDMKLFSQRIEVALKVIKAKSPSSWERFSAFTDVIIPIKDEELVSYSHQNLPGYSMINLYHRDFVDLMDDLLHENGHHHLNYYLNLSKLIEESPEEIYYSPWRRSPRPLRGIYHAYFTFFWAFKLFADLISAKEMDSIWYVFNNEQKEKILWRAVEEYNMLHYSFLDLKRARKAGLIHEQGWELVQSQQQELKKYKNKVAVWEKGLKGNLAEIRKLKRELKTAEKNWR